MFTYHGFISFPHLSNNPIIHRHGRIRTLPPIKNRVDRLRRFSADSPKINRFVHLRLDIEAT